MNRCRPAWPAQSILATAVLTALAVAAQPAMATVQRAVTVVKAARPAAAATPASAKTWHSVPMGAHTLYGTISALSGSQLLLRLRNGRSLPVDASAAIASGSFSAPLFVGKMVTIDGALQNGKYVAAHIIRLTNLEDLPPDH
jgi:hypothetical protein